MKKRALSQTWCSWRLHGSRRLPLKYPNATEPVVPEEHGSHPRRHRPFRPRKRSGEILSPEGTCRGSPRQSLLTALRSVNLRASDRTSEDPFNTLGTSLFTTGLADHHCPGYGPPPKSGLPRPSSEPLSRPGDSRLEPGPTRQSFRRPLSPCWNFSAKKRDL